MGKHIIQVKDYQWQVIINPNAHLKKCCSFWKIVETQLSNHDINYKVFFAKSSEEGMSIVSQLCKDGKRHFMVVGGDGTLNAVVNGICISGIPSDEVNLAVIPLGNGNDWTRTHSYPTHAYDCFELFFKGVFDSHDIGQIRSMNNEGSMLDNRYFINIAGFCFDARVIYEVAHKKIKLVNSLVYLSCLLKALFSYKSQTLSIDADNINYHDDTFTVAVGICRYNGGGMKQVPMAQYDDGLFDVVVIRKVSMMKVIQNVKYLFSGKHIEKMKEVSVFQTDKLKIHSQEPVLGEVEGELLIPGDYEISILPRAINVLVNNNE